MTEKTRCLLLLSWISIFIAGGLSGVILDSSIDDETEYCQWETMNATCRENEVLLIESAHYGRMKLGRCLTEDYFVGCSADVLTHVDQRCSGRRTCVITVPDPNLFNVQPCRKDLVAHFSVKYKCITVLTGEPYICTGVQEQLLPPSGYISNYITEETGLGAPHCPWRLSVSKGQHINFTLYDFFTWSEGSAYGGISSRSDACTSIGLIREGSKTKELRTCHQYHRITEVYTSTSNEVEVELVHPISMKKKVYVILKYEAVGCANLIPPANSYMSRKSDVAMVRCNHTSRTWHLVCRGTAWMGDIGNCSTGPGDKWKLGQVLEISGRFPYGILIAIGIGVILGIILGVSFLLVVLACHKRRRQRIQKTRESNALLREDGGIYGEQGGEIAYKLMEIRETSHGPATNIHITGDEPCCTMATMPPTLRRPRGDHVYESPHAGGVGGPGPGEMTLSGDMTLTLKLKDRLKAGGYMVDGHQQKVAAAAGAITTVDLIQQEPKTATLKKMCSPRDLSGLESPPGPGVAR